MADVQKEYLRDVLSKIMTVVNRGEKIMREIPGLVKKSQMGKHDPCWVEAAQVDEKVQKRRWGPVQAAKLAGISHSLLYTAEGDGRLPKPEYRTDTVKKHRSGYTMNHINHMRKVFEKAPRKPDGLSAAVIGVLNLKGGSQKTTICHLFSQYLAMEGYRVLLLDTDPQGSLSFYFGKRPDDNVHYEDTISPFFLEDDEALVDAGHPEGSSRNLRYAVQKTYWDNIDIIPSCLQNLNIDLMMPKVMDEANIPFEQRIMKLRLGLMDLADDYDFIIVDGTPSLNISTLNVVSACDMVFVPTPAAMLDYASTLQFAGLIAETIETYNDGSVAPNFPDIRFFITKYSGSSYAKFMGQIIRRVFTVERGDVLSNEAHTSDEIGKATNSTYSIYEQIPNEVDNRKKLKITIEMFDALFSEMHDAIWETCYDDVERAPHIDKIDEIMATAEKVGPDLKKVEKEGV